MKKIAVIGNSVTAIKTIEELKAQGYAAGEEIEAIFISPENTYPYFRHQLYNLPEKKITNNKILYRNTADYEKEKISFIFDKKITRVNFKRGRITLDDKEQIDYSLLLLADMPQAPFFGIKGANKNGLYNIKRLSDINAFLKVLPAIETILVQSDQLAGLKAALTFAVMPANPPRETILVTSRKNILSGLVSEADTVALEALVSQTGLRIITESQIAEILGDNDAKAVRLHGQNTKVLGCQAILTDADVPDLRLFKETELQHNQRVVVNQNYQTNFDNVFALDAVCDSITFNDWDISLAYPDVLQEHSKIITHAILKKEYVRQTPALAWEMEAGSEKIAFSASFDGSQPLYPLQAQFNKQEAAVNA